MQIIEDPNQMQEMAIKLRSQGKLIALVSTSGVLHAGHGAMIEHARKEADVVVVSAIVNLDGSRRAEQPNTEQTRQLVPISTTGPPSPSPITGSISMVASTTPGLSKPAGNLLVEKA